MSENRKTHWKQIWDKKYSNTRSKGSHAASGFNDLSIEEWSDLTSIIGGLFLKGSDRVSVCEIGCGIGSFLSSLPPSYVLSGVDYSESAIETIKGLMQGDFHVSEADSTPFDDASFDVVFSWSVFFYFDSIAYVEAAIAEMIRITKPGGTVFIGDINDSNKKHIYEKIRLLEADKREDHKVTDIVVDHLFISKDFFMELGLKNGINVNIIDEDTLKMNYYTSSLYRYSVVLET